MSCGRVNRRTFLADTGMGFTGLALGSLLHGQGIARADDEANWRTPDGKWDGSVFVMQHGQPVQVFVKLGLQGDRYSEVVDSSDGLDAGTPIATGVNAARTPPHP